MAISSSVIKPLALLAASAAFVLGGISMMRITNAQASALSGTCGAIFNLRTSADGPLSISGDVQSGINSGAIINFTNNTMSYSVTRQKLVEGASDEWTSVSSGPKQFTIKPDPELNGTYEMAMADANINIVMRVIPVNNGNTYLLQGKSLGTTGICQKIAS